MDREKYGVVAGETEDNVIKVASDEIVEKTVINNQANNNAKPEEESSSNG